MSLQPIRIAGPTVTTLRTVPLLGELPEDALASLVDKTHWHRYEAGSFIVRQNDDSTSVLFILSGFVKVMRGSGYTQRRIKLDGPERRQRERQPVMVALLGPGDVVGELAVLLDSGRSASVVALTPCELISCSGEHFVSCIERHPRFALAFLRKMAARLVAANHQIELMRGNLDGRIKALLRQCDRIGLDAARHLTNAEIARMVGATRVAVSQAVARLEKGGEATPYRPIACAQNEASTS